MSSDEDIRTPIDDRFYRLDGRTPVRCTFVEYSQSMRNDANRIVAQDSVGELQVSTVFTGIDRNWGDGSPILFETMVLGLPEDLLPQWGFSTWNDAITAHLHLVDSLTAHGVEPLLSEIRKKAAA